MKTNWNCWAAIAPSARIKMIIFKVRPSFYPFALQIRACLGIATRGLTWAFATPSLLHVSAHRCRSAALREHCGFTDMFLIKFNKFFFRLVRCNRCAACEANGGEGAIRIASMGKEGSASVCHRVLVVFELFILASTCEMHGVVAKSGSPHFFH